MIVRLNTVCASVVEIFLNSHSKLSKSYWLEKCEARERKWRRTAHFKAQKSIRSKTLQVTNHEINMRHQLKNKRPT